MMLIHVLKQMWNKFRSEINDDLHAITTATHSGWGLRINVYGILAFVGLLMFCPTATKHVDNVTLYASLVGSLPQIKVMAIVLVAFVVMVAADAIMTVGIRVARILHAPDKLELNTIEILERYESNLRHADLTQVADIIGMITEQFREASQAFISSSDDYILNPLERWFEITTETRPSGYMSIMLKRRLGITQSDVDNCNIFRNV